MAKRSAAAVLRDPRALYALVSVVLCAVVLLPFYRPAAHGLDVTGHQIGRDFINNWAGPQLAWGGRLTTLFDLDGYVDAISALFGQRLPFHNWGYPPFTLIFFWPLGQMPYFAALAVWTLGFFAIYAAVAARFVEPAKRPLLFLLVVLAPATLVNAVGGQNGFVTAALFLGGILALERRPILAGVLFGLLTSKPQLGLVLPLVLLSLGQWRTIAAACATTAVLVGASIAAFGLEPWRQYLGATSAFQLALVREPHGFYPYMMTSVLAQARLMGVSFPVAAALQGVVSAAVVLTSAWAVRRTRDNRERALILAAAAPLATPYAFNYDLTALSVVLAWRMVEEPAGAAVGARGLLYRLAWMLPIVLMPLNMAGLGLAPLVLVAVFATAVREVVSPRRAPVIAAAAAT